MLFIDTLVSCIRGLIIKSSYKFIYLTNRTVEEYVHLINKVFLQCEISDPKRPHENVYANVDSFKVHSLEVSTLCDFTG